MTFKRLFEFGTQCVANPNNRPSIRHEAGYEPISATVSHLSQFVSKPSKAPI